MSIGNEVLAVIVRDRLLADRRIAAQTIDVCCADGCVSLIGLVDAPEHKELAVQLVVGLIGVRSVKDEIGVRLLSAASPPTGPSPSSNRP